MTEKDSFKNIENKIRNFLENVVKEGSEEEIKEKFYEIWQSLQEFIYSINCSSLNLDNSVKQKLKKIFDYSVELSKEILKKVKNRHLRYLVVHVFLDWIINEAIKCDIDLPELVFPELFSSRPITIEHSVDKIYSLLDEENEKFSPIFSELFSSRPIKPISEKFSPIFPELFSSRPITIEHSVDKIYSLLDEENEKFSPIFSELFSSRPIKPISEKFSPIFPELFSSRPITIEHSVDKIIAWIKFIHY